MITFLLVFYLAAGCLVLFVVAPVYFRKRGIDTFGKDGSVWLLFTSLEGFAFALGLAILWPVLAPLWIWTETKANSEKSKSSRMESEKTANERKFANMTFEQKLEALKKASEDTPRKS